MVHLVSGEEDKIGFLDIQYALQEFDSERISNTLWQEMTIGVDGILATAIACYHVTIGDLHNFESAIFLDS